MSAKITPNPELPPRFLFDSDEAFAVALENSMLEFAKAAQEKGKDFFIPKRYQFNSDTAYIEACLHAAKPDPDRDTRPPRSTLRSPSKRRQSGGIAFVPEVAKSLDNVGKPRRSSVAQTLNNIIRKKHPATESKTETSHTQVQEGGDSKAVPTRRYSLGKTQLPPEPKMVAAVKIDFASSGVDPNWIALQEQKCYDLMENEPPEIATIIEGSLTSIDALEACATSVTKWIKEALSLNHKTKALKGRLGRLLGTFFFSSNLESLGLFEDLRDHCSREALAIGQFMSDYFETNQLSETVSRGLEKALVMDGAICPIKAVVYNEAKGLFEVSEQAADWCVGQNEITSAPFTGDDSKSQLYNEQVYIHVLRMVGMGVNAGFHEAIEKVCTDMNGIYRRTPIKNYTRLRDKGISRDDHFYAPFPRPSRNLDVNRSACTFDDVDRMSSFIERLRKHANFGGHPLRVKNMFSFDNETAETQFHYRSVMLNWIYSPGITYGELAEKTNTMWERYQEFTFAPGFGNKDASEPWDRWRDQIKEAASYIKSERLQNCQVQIIAETQVLLRPYMEGRIKMHLLYKIARAPTSVALFGEFSDSPAQRDTGYKQTKHRVAQKDALVFVQTLLKEKHPINDFVEDTDLTMLGMAADDGHQNVVRKLLGQWGMNVNLGSKAGSTPLFLATRHGHTWCVSQLLKHPDVHVNAVNNANDATPLFIACERGHEPEVRLLLEHVEIEVNKPEPKNGTPLHIACRRGHVDIVKLLLADPNIDVNTTKAVDMTTPLYSAVCFGDANIVKMLTQVEACNSSQPSLDGTTPLGISLFHAGFPALSSHVQSSGKSNARLKIIQKEISSRGGPNAISLTEGPKCREEESALVIGVLLAHTDLKSKSSSQGQGTCMVS